MKKGGQVTAVKGIRVVRLFADCGDETRRTDFYTRGRAMVDRHGRWKKRFSVTRSSAGKLVASGKVLNGGRLVRGSLRSPSFQAGEYGDLTCKLRKTRFRAGRR